jgi:transcriptional regulator with XRE-family HTH domain
MYETIYSKRNHIDSYMPPTRLNGLPAALRQELRDRRRQLGWSQFELGRRAHIPQVHVSRIETGKMVPRYDTLLEIVRILGGDLLWVPRPLVPMVQGMVRDHRRTTSGQADDADDNERPLYAQEEGEESEEQTIAPGEDGHDL